MSDSGERNYLPESIPEGIGLPAAGPVSERLFEMPPPPGASGSAVLRRMLSAVLRYKWLGLAVVIAGTGLGVLASRMVRPTYTARATIWIASEGNQSPQGPIQSPGLLQSGDWIGLLRSNAVMDYVVRELRLYLTYRPVDAAAMASFGVGSRFQPGSYKLTVDQAGRTYLLATDQGLPLERGAVDDSVGRRLGFLWRPGAAELRGGREIDFAVRTPTDAANSLRAQLQPSLSSAQANFLQIQLTANGPQRAATVLNAVLDRYIDVARELKRAKLDELTKILNQQLDYASGQLKNAEGSLESFRVATVTLPTDQGTPVAPGLEATRGPVYQQFFNMKIQREQLRRDREAILEALQAARDSSLSVDALSVIGAVQAAPALQQALGELTQKRAALRAIRQQYTDQYPDVQKAIRDEEMLEKQTVPRLAMATVADLQTREASLDRLISSASADLQNIPPRTIEEQRLRRQVATTEGLYNTLEQRYENARLAAETSLPDLQILDRATAPQAPTRDMRPRIIVLAVLGSLALAVAGPILLDRLDQSVRYPEQVTSEIGLPILGALPQVKRLDAGGPDVAHMLEALRTVRMNLLHAYGSAGPLVVTVSSPGSGDGKSFLIANLGLAFVNLGYRTLVIDADIRRGALHRLLNAERKPGLTDYLAGRVAAEDVVQETSHSGLHIIASGSRLQNGPELLASPEMRDLVLRMRSAYDVILLDSSPLGAGIDPFVLGTLSGNLVLVLRTGRTEKELALTQLNLVERLPIRVLGAVLNGIEQGGVYREYSYLPGYGVGQDDEGERRRLAGVETSA